MKKVFSILVLVFCFSEFLCVSSEAKITSKEAIGKVQGETYINKVMGARAYFSKDNWKILTQEEIFKSQAEMRSKSKNLEELLSNSNNATIFYVATHDSMANINIVASNMGIMAHKIKKDSEIKDFVKQMTSGLKEQLYRAYKDFGCENIEMKNTAINFIGKNCYGADIIVTLNNGVEMYQKQVYCIADEYCYIVTATSVIADITDDLLAMFKKSAY